MSDEVVKVLTKASNDGAVPLASNVNNKKAKNRNDNEKAFAAHLKEFSKKYVFALLIIA